MTVVASDGYGGSAVQNVKVNVSATNQIIAAAGLGGAAQTFVFDTAQRVTMIEKFQVADTTMKGVTTPHSVLTLARSMFNAATADSSASAMTALVAAHSSQAGNSTLIVSDTGQRIELVGVNRQTFLAHPADVAFA